MNDDDRPYDILELSLKIINVFDIAIVIFEKKENIFWYVNGNDYFKTNNPNYNQNNKLGDIFPFLNKPKILRQINNSMLSNKPLVIHDKEIINMYTIENKYIVFCFMDRFNKNSEKTQLLLHIMNYLIRTPLNNINHNILLLLETNLNEIQRDYIQNIHNSSLILINTIINLLDFLKLETRNMNLTMETFDIESCINLCIDMIRKRAKEKNIQIYKIIDPTIPQTMYGDKQRLIQSIHNILDNAIKFTEKGYIKIEVYEHQNQNLNIKISDTGIGMNQERIDFILNSFELNTYNTGMGLPITKYLVDLMNGQIHIKSRLNKGTIVNINLPYKEHVSIKNVIAVVADKTRRFQLYNYLISHDFIPTLCLNIEELQMYLNTGHFDIILLDKEYDTNFHIPTLIIEFPYKDLKKNILNQIKLVTI